jgi:hypothetical protein
VVDTNTSSGSRTKRARRAPIVVAVCGPGRDRALCAAAVGCLTNTHSSTVILDADPENLLASWAGVSIEDLAILDRRQHTFLAAMVKMKPLVYSPMGSAPSLIFAGLESAALELNLSASAWARKALKSRIERLGSSHEFVILSCAPELSNITRTLIRSADVLVIPFALEDRAQWFSSAAFATGVREVARRTDRRSVLVPVAREAVSKESEGELLARIRHDLSIPDLANQDAMNPSPRNLTELLPPILLKEEKLATKAVNEPNFLTQLTSGQHPRLWAPVVECLERQRPKTGVGETAFEVASKSP